MSVLTRYVSFNHLLVQPDARDKVPNAPDTAAVVNLSYEFKRASEFHARVSLEFLDHGSYRDARGYFSQQMDVVFSSVHLDDMERWVQKLCFTEARQECLLHIGFQELHSVFCSPYDVIFELVHAMVQPQDSHGYSLALRARTFIPAVACGVSC